MARAAPLNPGAVFASDYRIVRPLSEGGMGAVYVVEQISTGAPRALKLMLHQFVQDPKLRKRFEQEARVGAQIKSDHVVQVLAAGVDDESAMPWLVMELLEGEDLAAFINRRGQLSPPEVAEIFAQLCHALAAAHSVGVVHRDLKPENIFLAVSHREGASFIVKVLDFGIAKVVAEAHNATTGPVGTPLYMAPEQTMPGQSIVPATDVWALGLIAYRLLTGRSYWRGANVEPTSPVMLLREIVMDPLLPASQRAAEYGAGALLPPGFDGWFERCVAREPQQRYPSAAEARVALGSVLGDVRTSQSSLASLAVGAQGPRVPSGSPAFDATVAVGEQPSVATTTGGVAPSLPPDSELDRLSRSLVTPSGGRGLVLVAGAVVVAALAVAGFFARRSSESDAAAAATGAATAAGAGRCPADMAYLPAGTYVMGDTKEQVSVAALCLDLTEVTSAAYARCASSGKCTDKGLTCGPLATSGSKDKQDHPINCVEWEQALSFCDAQGQRLPTEQEWEWAARGGAEASAYPWGGAEPRDQLCWSGSEVKHGATCAVGTFPIGDNPQRIHDLAGNVAEWTASRYEPNGVSRVYRGGSYSDEHAGQVRAAARGRAAPTERGELLGFRCAKNVQ